MKRHTAVMKILVAFLLLLALTSWLLPFCTIGEAGDSKTISGIEVLKAGAEAGYEYYTEGHVDDDFQIGEQLTWGELKVQLNEMNRQTKFEMILFGTIVLSSVTLSGIAMILTLTTGKRGLIAATVLTGLASFGNLILIFFYRQGRSGGSVPVIAGTGLYAFFLLSEIAFLILFLLWVTGGYQNPKQKKKRPRCKKKKSGKRRKKRKKKANRTSSARNRSKRTRTQRKKGWSQQIEELPDEELMDYIEQQDDSYTKKVLEKEENAFMDYSTIQINEITEILKEVSDQKD